MDNFILRAPTKYIFGRETEKSAGQQLKDFGAKNVLIVYGGGSVIKSGLLDRVRLSIDEAGINHMEIGGIKPNPTDDQVYKGIDLVRSHGIDFLLAVGGGSVIDTAKGIACGAPYEGDFWDFYCGKKIVDKALPVGVVLTIPAAGSEGSGNSVITKRDGLIKLSLRTESALRPKFAIMNPELTFTLPPYQTACGIVDMMAHIFERYFTNTPDCQVTDRVAEGLLTAIMEEAPKVIAKPNDYQARANIMWCGTLAHNGLCGTGRVEDWASHFMEHELSAIYDVAHGAGLAVVNPAWMTYVATKNPDKILQFAIRVMKVNDEGMSQEDIIREGISRLKEFYISIGMPVTLSQLGIENPDLDRLVNKLHEHKGNPIGNYVRLTPDDTRLIYEMMA
ncbi:iron-containing alcohol dehydrogenase [Heminiphilus faecis]|jgi:hypothetical protein|uniref:Iron-containing alcohol dehydrogenase n=1 Tax=Heminiphilus faecis TaxID=2601703 RepID=A0ABV4CYI6_9BACT|nr:iron-containing alcohol dehydrogenase [Heminiphilus faecis]RLT77262.1 iron-containing alcohol dehydrogenase [bacterium J10(2018)]